MAAPAVDDQPTFLAPVALALSVGQWSVACSPRPDGSNATRVCAEVPSLTALCAGAGNASAVQACAAYGACCARVSSRMWRLHCLVAGVPEPA